MAQEIKMSAAGLKAMQEELEYLKTVRRKELAEEIIARRSEKSFPAFLVMGIALLPRRSRKPAATATCRKTASTTRPRTPRVWWRTASPSWSR